MKTDSEEFEKWCLAESTNQDSRILSLRGWFKGVLSNTNDPTIVKFLPRFAEIAVNENYKNLIDLNLTETGNYPSQGAPLNITFKHERYDDTGITNKDPIKHFLIRNQNLIVAINQATILKTEIQENLKEVTFENCDLAELVIVKCRMARLKNCRIGTLYIEKNAIHLLSVEDCVIHAVKCPVPVEANPFLGSVTFVNTKFVIPNYESKLYQGPQQFRNLRFHLEELENQLEAGKMRSLELAAERNHENSRINKFVSWYQDKFSNYGQAPARPLLWAIGLYFAMVALVGLFDIPILEARAPDGFFDVGWKNILQENSCNGQIVRALILPGQYIVSPFGIFGAPTLLVPKSGWWNLGLSIGGLICDILIATSFLAIRKRFKLH